MMTRATPWIIALLISVLANGAMLGLTLHRVSDGPRFQPAEHRQPAGVRGDGFSLRGFLAGLPPEYRDDAMERMRESRDDVIARVETVHAAQANVEAVLQREPFDADAVRQALAELRQARGEMEVEVEDAVLDIIAALPPEGRLQALQAGLQSDRMRHRRPPHHESQRRGPRPG
ncbi:MAG TPA: hypothetical protein DCQ53_11755 [Alphaproteobacteria bacterium]|nr:hypothetical protein [Alphaproteobacteria bacterium]